MYKMTIFMLVGILGLPFLSSAQAKVVSVPPGDGSIQSAIDDANTVDGDILELQTGTHSGLIDFTKSLTVQPAAGASPEVRFVGHAFGDRLLQASGASIEVVWNDVPIVADTDFTWLVLTGDPSLSAETANTVTFNNVTFSDTSNNTGRGYLAYAWAYNTLNLNNCTMTVRAWRVFVTELGTATLNINDSYISVDDDGANLVQTVFITHPAGQINLQRTIVDMTPQTPTGTTVVYNENAGNAMSFTNSVIWHDSGKNTLSYWLTGDLAFNHCTFVDKRPQGTLQGSHLFLANSTNAEKPGKLTLKNNIFDMTPEVEETTAPTLTAFINDGGTPSGEQQIVFDIGENMLPEGVTSVAGGNDPINYGGQVIANPLLDSDGIHLTEGSPAINAASDIGVTDDFDGGARPYDGGFDFGADEFGSEPAPPPNSVRHWNPY